MTDKLFYKILQGNCVEVLKEFEENSIDCCITDPPYGISFMGKNWDQALPPKEAFEQIFRVLKPGALAFVMSSPRQDVLWRMLKILADCGFVLKQSFISWIYKTGFPKAYDVSKGIEKKLGKQRKIIGLKSITGLKPALECILMVNKPMSEKTIVDNVLKYGTGAINVDACRIPLQGSNERGRFPANLLVSDGALDTGELTTSAKSTKVHRAYGDSFKFGGGISTPDNQYNDSGGTSRFFDLDTWAKHYGFLDVPKASKAERDKGITDEGRIPERHGVMKRTPKHAPNRQHKQRNFHPTVKPIKLMAYLIELGCPKDGIVLDPFLGSGTTMIACKQLGRSCIGIEKNPEYIKIAKQRVKGVIPLKPKKNLGEW